MKREILIPALVLTVMVLSFFGFILIRSYSSRLPEVPTIITVTTTTIIPSTTTVSTIPESFSINVPYSVQAPEANWAIHEESCEEAAALMYHYFLKKTSFPNDIIPPAQASSEIIAMKNWQVNRYGKEPDLKITELGEFVKEYYGYNYEHSSKTTKEDIMGTISTGKPIIVPVITHALQNPNYGPNPSYHVLLIKGYNQNGVITNDAGIKEGKDYFYSWETLFSAIDAQTIKMNQGREMITLTLT